MMTTDEIIKRITGQYAPLSPACQAALLEVVSVLSFEKGHTLVREGQYADKAFFIVEGCARAYYLKDGKDVSDWFAFEGEFISSIVSFFTHQMSPHYIELLEDAILLELSREAVEMLADQYHDFERLVRMVVTKTMLQQHERIVGLQFNTAEQRYEQLLTIRPNITQRVPLTHIASYLGITLETLSRIRNPKKRI